VVISAEGKKKLYLIYKYSFVKKKYKNVLRIYFLIISRRRLVAASAPGPAVAAARVVGVFASASVEEEGRLAGASMAASPSAGRTTASVGVSTASAAAAVAAAGTAAAGTAAAGTAAGAAGTSSGG
jgi:hypothetical protein